MKTDPRIQLQNDVTGETSIEFAGQTYTLCFDTAAVLAIEKARGDRPVMELLMSALSAIDCVRLLMIGSQGGRRRLRGPGGTIGADVAQAILEEFGPFALNTPLQNCLGHASCLHLYDDEKADADPSKDAADPLAGLAG